MIEIQAYHGWGFSSNFWDDLKKEFPKEILFKAADRGYYGGEFLPEFNENSNQKIVLTHSYGLHWCPNEVLDVADLVVVFCGFDNFLPNEFLDKRKELKVLKRMVKQFKITPIQVLEAFFTNCFNPIPSNLGAPKWFNGSKLLSDLNALKNCSLKLRHTESKKWVSIIGDSDQIVSKERFNDLSSKIRFEESLEIKGAGHALPIVNSKECWSFLNSVLPIFDQHAKEDSTE